MAVRLTNSEAVYESRGAATEAPVPSPRGLEVEDCVRVVDSWLVSLTIMVAFQVRRVMYVTCKEASGEPMILQRCSLCVAMLSCCIPAV